MNKKNPSLVFFGNEQLVTGFDLEPLVFNKLISEGFDIKALIVSQRSVTSRRKKISAITEIARKNDIEVIELTTMKSEQTIKKIASLKADAGVLVAFGIIISQSVIDLFRDGIINLHPSILPEHRGPTPIESTILNRDKQSGVSIIKLVAEMDAGPIYEQRTLGIGERPTKFELAQSLHEIGCEMILETLNKISKGTETLKIQDNSKATFDKKITTEDGVIDWSEDVQVIDAKVRAYYGWPWCRTKINDIEVIIVECQPVKIDHAEKFGSIDFGKKHLSIFAKNGYLKVSKVKVPGKNEMDITSFMSGYKSRLIEL